MESLGIIKMWKELFKIDFHRCRLLEVAVFVFVGLLSCRNLGHRLLHPTAAMNLRQWFMHLQLAFPQR